MAVSANATMRYFREKEDMDAPPSPPLSPLRSGMFQQLKDSAGPPGGCFPSSPGDDHTLPLSTADLNVSCDSDIMEGDRHDIDSRDSDTNAFGDGRRRDDACSFGLSPSHFEFSPHARSSSHRNPGGHGGSFGSAVGPPRLESATSMGWVSALSASAASTDSDVTDLQSTCFSAASASAASPVSKAAAAAASTAVEALALSPSRGGSANKGAERIRRLTEKVWWKLLFVDMVDRW